MTFFKRVGGLLVFLLSIVFLIACTYGIVEAWLFRPKLTQSTAQILGHVEELLNSTAKGTREVQTALVQARAKLGEAREASTKSTDNDASRQVALSLAAWKIKEEFGPQLGNIQATLTGVTQAAIVANTLVQDFDKSPLAALPKVDVEQLQASMERLSEVGKSAQELSRQLSGPADKGARMSAADLATRTTPIENTLREVQAVAGDFEDKVADTKTRVAWVQSKAPDWITWGTYGATGILLWIAISQVSLMCHSWSWLKGRELN